MNVRMFNTDYLSPMIRQLAKCIYVQVIIAVDIMKGRRYLSR